MDMIIHAGDLVDRSVYDALTGVCKDVQVVCGNMDPVDLKDRFPQKKIIKVGGVTLGIVHGWGPPKQLLAVVKDIFKDDSPDIVIFGHSHNALSKKEGRTLYFNPGSPTDDVFAPYKSFGIIEITDTIDARIVRL